MVKTWTITVRNLGAWAWLRWRGHTSSRILAMAGVDPGASEGESHLHLQSSADLQSQGAANLRVFVCYGDHNKLPQIGSLRQEKLITSQFWKPEVQNAGGSRLGSLGGRKGTPAPSLWPWCMDGHLLPGTLPSPSRCTRLCPVKRSHSKPKLLEL